MATLRSVKTGAAVAADREERRPLVSVVVPHYNYGRYLATAVGSALSQPGVEVEVIIVDDRSTDGSLETARSIARSDARIRLVEHPVNMRHIATYNDGLRRARGDYIVLLSADDALAPGALARAVGLLEARPDVVLVYGKVETFADELPAAPLVRDSTSVWPGREWLEMICRRGRNVIVNPEVVMRRETFDAIGGYDPELPHSADLYLWMRAAARGAIGRVDGPTQAYYRDHGRNMHHQDFGGVLDDAIAVRRTFDMFFAHDGDKVPSSAALRARARRAVAREALVRAVSLLDRGAPALAVEQLRAFAVETDPSVRVTAAWWWSGFAVRGGWRRPMVRAVERARWSIRWHLLTRAGR